MTCHVSVSNSMCESNQGATFTLTVLHRCIMCCGCRCLDFKSPWVKVKIF